MYTHHNVHVLHHKQNKSLSSSVPAKHRRLVEKNIKEEARRHSSTNSNRHSFTAKYVPFNAGFDSAKWYSLDEIVYCSCSGGLLDVQHNMDTWKKFNGAYGRSLFDSCVGKTTWSYGSVVWSKKQWVLSELKRNGARSSFSPLRKRARQNMRL